MEAVSLTNRIARVLFNYRITPQTTTGLSPSELLMVCRLNSHLDMMVPSVSRRVQQSQSQQMTTQNFKPVIARLLRETECTPTILLPEQQSSGYQVKWYRSQDHFHAKHSCRTKLFGRDTRITFNYIRKCFTEQLEEVTTPLDTVPQEE